MQNLQDTTTDRPAKCEECGSLLGVMELAYSERHEEDSYYSIILLNQTEEEISKPDVLSIVCASCSAEVYSAGASS